MDGIREIIRANKAAEEKYRKLKDKLARAAKVMEQHPKRRS
jgi:hypothetical protein